VCISMEALNLLFFMKINSLFRDSGTGDQLDSAMMCPSRVAPAFESECVFMQPDISSADRAGCALI
jgi:hypothetical protein